MMPQIFRDSLYWVHVGLDQEENIQRSESIEDCARERLESPIAIATPNCDPQ